MDIKLVAPLVAKKDFYKVEAKATGLENLMVVATGSKSAAQLDDDNEVELLAGSLVAWKAYSLAVLMEVSRVDYLADALVDKRVGCLAFL